VRRRFRSRREALVAEQRATVLDRSGCGSNDLVRRRQSVDDHAELVQVGGQLVPALGDASAEALPARAAGPRAR
jgi:hypothetical protein